MPVERGPLTRTLAHLLRHEPWRHGVALDEHGWADLDRVVEQLRRRRYPGLTPGDVLAAVAEDDHQRFEVHGGAVRARYGHSVAVRPGEVAEPPPVLYAAVPRARFRDVALEGLRPRGGRAFVHLTEAPDEAREAGARGQREEPVLLEVRAREARARRGLVFRHTGHLWLVDEVPPEFLAARG
jgi:putative RNA 2'-phosphotransferase